MATTDERIMALEQMLENLPGDLNVRFDHARAERDEIKAQISRLQADMSVLKVDVASLKTDMIDLKAEVKALPRVIAEMLKS